MAENGVQAAAEEQRPVDAEPEPVTADSVELVFGLPLAAVYRLAMKFYKEQEKCGKLQIDYAVRLRFMAFSKQARYGAYRDELADCGWFDLVGNDAKKEWQKLRDLSKEEAMLEFVRLMDVVCPAFKPYAKAQAALEAPKQNGKNANFSALLNGRVDSKEVIEKYQQQKKQIQEALNKQTYHQFLAYAQQTLPGQPQKELLIKQLQEQHYEQYMAQVYAQQAQSQAEMLEGGANGANGSGPAANGHGHHSENNSDSEAGPKPADAYLQQGLERPAPKVGDEEDESDASETEIRHEVEQPNPRIAPASLWNNKNIEEFKANIRKEGPEGVIKVGHGETVTVRVPTHEEGTHLYWEFATDYYDIGFGVYFEWTVAESNQVTVHVSESDDEEDYDEEAEQAAAQAAAASPNDVESGGPSGGGSAAAAGGKPRDPNKPRVDEVIPVYRRESHEEVYAGSHSYPGQGVYLLKFDNSYSLWRSKTLYYRVFYSK